MTELDKMEEWLEQLLLNGEYEDMASWTQMNGRLLIRAVRQLGAKLDAHLYSMMYEIDDEVVKLFAPEEV